MPRARAEPRFAGIMVGAYFAVFPVAFVGLLRSRLVRPAFAIGEEASAATA